MIDPDDTYRIDGGSRGKTKPPQIDADAILSAGFSEIAEAIRRAPTTWIPALLITAVEAGVTRNVFRPGGAAEIAKRAEDRLIPKEETR